MPAQHPPDTSEAAFDRLSLVRVGKDLFLSEWFRHTSETLFDAEARELLRRIGQETSRERELAMDVMHRWADDMRSPGAPKDFEEVTRLTRLDILETLVEAKTAAGESLERVARAAPPQLRDQLLELAAVDFRHAVELRSLLTKEFEWRARRLASGARPSTQ